MLKLNAEAIRIRDEVLCVNYMSSGSVLAI